jgi:hypothetical protein
VLVPAVYELEAAELNTIALLLASARVMQTHLRRPHRHAAALNGSLGGEAGRWNSEAEGARRLCSRCTSRYEARCGKQS